MPLSMFTYGASSLLPVIAFFVLLSTLYLIKPALAAARFSVMYFLDDVTLDPGPNYVRFVPFTILAHGIAVVAFAIAVIVWVYRSVAVGLL
jgi:hypothetical protein